MKNKIKQNKNKNKNKTKQTNAKIKQNISNTKITYSHHISKPISIFSNLNHFSDTKYLHPYYVRNKTKLPFTYFRQNKTTLHVLSAKTHLRHLTLQPSIHIYILQQITITLKTKTTHTPVYYNIKSFSIHPQYI